MTENNLPNFNDDAFKAQLDAVYDKLWSAIPEPRPQKPEMAWEVTPDVEANVTHNRKTNTITFSAGLLNDIDNEAQLAGLIALACSEAPAFRDVITLWKTQLEQDSRESSANVQKAASSGIHNEKEPAVVQWLRQSGYDTHALANCLESGRSDRRWMKINGFPVMDYGYAVEALDQGLGSQSHAADQGLIPFPQTGKPLESSLRNALTQHFEEITHLQQEAYDQAQKRWNAYDDASFQEKCDVLAWAVEGLNDKGNPHNISLKQIEERIQNLNLKEVSATDRDSAENLVKAVLASTSLHKLTEVQSLSDMKDAAVLAAKLLGRKNDTAVLYNALVKAEGLTPDKKGQPLVGEGLKKLERSIAAFVNAGDEEAAAKAAKDINGLVEEYHVGPEAGMAMAEMKGFSLPEDMKEGEFVSPPWEQHLAFASRFEEGSAQRSNIRSALHFLGAGRMDPRLRGGGHSLNYVKPVPPVLRNGGEAQEFYIRPDGKMAPVSVKRVDFKDEIQKQLETEAAELVEKADWKTLATDFDGFVQRNAAMLVPYEIWHKSVQNGKKERAIQSILPAHLKTLMEETGYSVDIQIETPQLFMQKLVEEAGKIENPEVKEKYTRFLEKTIEEVSQWDPLQENHPYIKAYIALDNISDEAKLYALNKVDLWGRSHGGMGEKGFSEEKWQFSLIDKLGYEKGNASVERLEQFIARINQAAQSAPETHYEAINAAQAVMAYAIHDTLKKVDKVSSLDDVQALRDIEQFVKHSPVETAFYDKASALVMAYVEESTQKADLQGQLNIYKAVSAHKADGGGMLNQMPAVRKQIEANFKKHVETKLASNEPAEREEGKAFLEELLRFNTIAREDGKGWGAEAGFYSGPNLHGDFGKWAADTYLAEWAQDFVKENGNGMEHEGLNPSPFQNAFDALHHKLMPDDVTSRSSRMHREHAGYYKSYLLSALSQRKLGNVLLLQGDDCAYLENRLATVGAKGRTSAKSGNPTLDNAVQEAVFRSDWAANLKKYLFEPYSEKSAASFIKATNGALFHGPFAFLSSALGLKFKPLLPENLPHEKKVEMAKDIHAAFWELDFGERGMLMSEMVEANFNAGNKDALNEAKNQALPRPVMGASNRGEVNRARQIVTAYLQASSTGKSALLMRGMMVANPPGDSKEEAVSIGQGLKLVLSELGPAGDKLMQAIESYPGTPEDIRRDLQATKMQARDLDRGTIMQMVERSNADLDFDSADRIVKVGEVLGAGSYGVTVKGMRPDGQWIARTILYSNGHAQAKTEFDTIRKAMDILEKQDKAFYAPLKSIVEQAAHMVDVEMDMELAKEQASVAEKLYRSGAEGDKAISVEVNGQEVRSFATPCIGHGGKHKDFAIIEGDHFLDKVEQAKKGEGEKTQAGKDVENLATALLTMELGFLMRGLPMDYDRHGGQQRITSVEENGKTRFEVGQFDFGALETKACSAREKQMIGHALAGLMYDLEVKKKSFGDALMKEMKEIPQNQQEADFMAKVQRGVLALGNFASNMPEDKNIGHVLGALYAQGYIDPVVEQAMRERLGKYADKAFGELEEKGKQAGIKLNSELAVEQFAQPEAQPAIETVPALGKGLDAIPVSDQNIRRAAFGTAAVAGLAGAGLAAKAYGNSRQKKEQQQAEQPQQPNTAEQKTQKKKVMLRVTKIAGIALNIVGAALLYDGLMNQGRKTRSVVGSVVGDKKAGVFSTGNTVITGAAIAVTGELTLLLNKFANKRQKKAEKAEAQQMQHQQNVSAPAGYSR